MSTSELVCFRCGTAQTFSGRIGRKECCSQCDADLHCCRNCRHYHTGAHNDCNEPQAEWVREKDRANYCDYFDPGRGSGADKSGTSRMQDARARFEDLFKK